MITTAIQAGGRSSRMGEDKALLKLHGVPLIELVLHEIEDLTDEILITTNNPKSLEYLHVRLVTDPMPGEGALRGLHTALASANNEHVLVIACDMPFVQKELLAAMLSINSSDDVIVPMLDGNYEPMHAIYLRTPCLQAVENALNAGEKKLTSFFHNVRVHTLGEEIIGMYDPEGLSFYNINTPQDLQMAEGIYQNLRDHEKD